MGKEASQLTFSKAEVKAPSGPVECLGLTFPDDEARRAYFREELRAALEEMETVLGGRPFTTPEDAVERLRALRRWGLGDEERLRELAARMRGGKTGHDLLQRFKDEIGFPHGAMEDILGLSDPPYYTACPNPFLAEFVQKYGTPYVPGEPYRREPFAADVSEGKNDPVYNAHSYHTKVPHKAIMRYILHYTQPGDLVFDGFAGTGMTGVAAQTCADKATVEELGYRVDEDGTIFASTEEEGGKVWTPFSRLGARRALLNDLSPAASFIAYNYNTPVDAEAFRREAEAILAQVEAECGWMYLTLHEPREEALAKAVQAVRENATALPKTPGFPWGRINYTVWSDVFVCPHCAAEVIFWEAAVDKEAGTVRDAFTCLNCGGTLTKRTMKRAWETKLDKDLKETIRQAKQVPVLINYSFGKKRFEKKPDAFDLALLEEIEKRDIPYWYPTDRMPDGDKIADPLNVGITRVSQFYTKRNLWVLTALRKQLNESQIKEQLLCLVGDLLPRASKMHKIAISRLNTNLSKTAGVLGGTLYIPSNKIEYSVISMIKFRTEDVISYQEKRDRITKQYCETTSSAFMSIPSLTLDYIFTDPPFGGNLMYSELNFLWESWLQVFTNNVSEAIENNVQGKGLSEYQKLMTYCFQEFNRVLKPGRWMTVEFHNSKNSVWKAIQEALEQARFVVADVRTLDKKQGSYNQANASGAVKQDLVISAYKPNGGLEERFKQEAGTEEGVWDFVRTHLRQLPRFAQDKDGRAEMIQERMNYLLFDRMVAFHVRRGSFVPVSAAEFYAGLDIRFPKRDKMYFLPDQVNEYDQKRLASKELLQLQFIVTDEASAIQWLRQQLTNKPQTFTELHPSFTKQMAAWEKHEKLLELSELLRENFLCYDDPANPIPSQIIAWLKTRESLKKKIQTIETESDQSTLGLLTKDRELHAAAADHWFVPDPNQAQDLEKLRERTLLKEFAEYCEFEGRRLKVFRMEAIRAGFKKAWGEKDYSTVVTIAKKIPPNILEEDSKLLMWYDQAITRTGG